jgi:hypothetical protein
MNACKRQWIIASYNMVLPVQMMVMGYYYTGYSLWSRGLCLCLSLNPGFHRWPAQLCLIGGHNDGIISSMDHPRFKSGQATSDNGMRQHWDNDVVLQDSRDSVNPIKKGLRTWVDHMVLNYDMSTLNIIYYIYNASWYFFHLIEDPILYYFLRFL